MFYFHGMLRVLDGGLLVLVHELLRGRRLVHSFHIFGVLVLYGGRATVGIVKLELWWSFDLRHLLKRGLKLIAHQFFLDIFLTLSKILHGMTLTDSKNTLTTSLPAVGSIFRGYLIQKKCVLLVRWWQLLMASYWCAHLSPVRFMG